jgi:tetratricopeptide (TPR) repeat protein
MSKQTDKSLFIVSSMSGLYQVLRSGIDTHKELGNRIIREIKAAHAFRQVEKVAELSQILVKSPIKEYQLIGQYYLAWSKYRDKENQPQILEKVIEQSRTYKTKALISRAALEVYKGNLEHALYLYTESFKTNPTVSDYIVASRGIATLKSIEGFKESALKDLETLLSLLRHAEPFASADVLNSYAVELGEAGRKDEARNVIQQVLATPFAIAYPEWRETAEELKEPNRSFAVISSLPLRPHNVLSMPAFERDDIEFPAWAGQPAPVLSYEKWTQRMAKKKKNGNKPVEQLNEKDMLLNIINIYTSDETTDATRFKIYDAVMKALSGPDKPATPETPNDDNPGA